MDSGGSFGENITSDDAGFSRSMKLTQSRITGPLTCTHQEKVEVELQVTKDSASVAMSGFCWQ